MVIQAVVVSVQHFSSPTFAVSRLVRSCCQGRFQICFLWANLFRRFLPEFFVAKVILFT